ncbi:helix-turn-helix domain-containing protein [Acinetobacter proteolyticus]|uniref:HTH cro/C1-type domain-containing protein n=1 Tax=Acinetobacter proteolyticus TaxID=1776741 RepID=A0A2N0WID0_9GAMM|nr:helix-turn-helix transcriptional regulator [Acinetobacter proteolyticus]PKF35521.1 hypothetical protein CW311_04320 [Acinetobacter proteolyticus]
MDVQRSTAAKKETTAYQSTLKKPSTTNTSSRQDQALLSCEVGVRMRESRIMSGLSQVDAAARLGYGNSSKLAKIEKGQSSRIPLWVLRKAAILYDVSCDYLLGVTETMERDDVSHASLRELHAFMYADFDRRHAQDIAAMVSLNNTVVTIKQSIIIAGMQAQQMDEAKIFVEKQPEWQEIRGGNRLMNSIDRITHTINSTTVKFKDLQKTMQAKSGTEYQMNLLLEA